MERLVPKLPDKDQRIRLLIDTDAANEIDDLYAISLALVSPDRFDLVGLVATHFAASDNAGPESIDRSYRVICTLLEKAGLSGRIPVLRGGHPMQYRRVPSPSEGCDFIIEQAQLCTPEEPLWVLGLGAATNLASAILKEPAICDRVRYIFHARSEHTWPHRSEQYNVKGDVLAAMALLDSSVPLVWFDTGTHITASFARTEADIAPTGDLGAYIHEYRRHFPYWMTDQKGFFDLGDVAWLLCPEICHVEEVAAVRMDRDMRMFPTDSLGRMLRVSDIDNEYPWTLLAERLRRWNG